MDSLELVRRIQSDLEQLALQFASPSSEAFHLHHEAVELLERALYVKTALDASFTYSAMKAGAGSEVGSTKTLDYLTKRLRLTKAEARHRMDLANRLHRTSDPVAEACLNSASQQPMSADTARIINKELGKLDPSLREHIPTLYAQAAKASQNGNPDEVRRLLRDLVAEKNNELDPDPQRARRKRSFRMGTQDRDGGVEFSGYAPAADAAMLEAAIAHGLRSGAKEKESLVDEQRSFTQLRYDALMGIIRKFESLRNDATGKGLGTIALSMTEDDVAKLSPTSQIRTNTSYRLTPYEVLALGITARGMSILHGPNGDPVSAISHSRHATIEQRIILAATEGVCSHPGCDRAPIWCDAHHITAWIQGGHTSLDNLTLLCRHHHTSNDDTKKRPDRGHAHRCSHTNRTGFRPPGSPPDGPLQFNDSYPANQSAGARIRAT